MKKGLLKGLVLTMGIVVATSTTAFASNFVTPTLIEGNDSNHSSHIHSMENAKVDKPSNGSYFFANGRIEVIVNNKTKSIDVKVLEETVNVEFIHMKGGNSFNCYNYEGDLLKGISQDENLICPNNNGGNQADISHFTIYWEEVEVEEVHPPTILPDDILIPEFPVGDGSEDDQIMVEPPVLEGEDDFLIDQPATEEEGELPEIGVDVPATEGGELPEIGVEPPVGDGSEDDQIMVEPNVEDGSEEDKNTVPPTEEENKEEEPKVEEVKPQEPTVEREELPQTGGVDSLMVILGGFGMVGTGLSLFKRK